MAVAENFKGIYAITPDYLFGVELIKLVERTLDAGINIIQYRFNKNLSKREVIDTAETLFKKVQAFGAEFIVNNDVNLANDLFTGLHVGPDFKNEEVLDQKNNIKFVGFSCKNSLDPQKNDIHNRFDYYSFGPTYFSKTKMSQNGTIDINKISSQMDSKKVNVAIGGINLKNLAQIKQKGFDCAAICNGIYHDSDKIERNIKEMIKVWNEN